MIRQRKFQAGVAVLATAVCVLLFQNCGAGFQVIEQASIASFSVPSITLVGDPPSVTNADVVTLKFKTTVDARSGVQSLTCELDGAKAQDCKSLEYSMPSLTPGDHKVVVRLTDNRGQKSDDLVVIFVIDRELPVLSFSMKPSSTTQLTSDSFGIVVSDNQAPVGKIVLECSLDQKTYAACGSTFAVKALAEGPHDVRVRATDLAGNVATMSYSWKIDLTAPTARFTQTPPAVDKSSSTSFTFDGLDGQAQISRLECQLDGGGFSTCTSPRALNALTDTVHKFEVVAIDSAGNRSAPAAYSWRVDTVAPTLLSLASNATAVTRTTGATFTFSSTDTNGSGIARYECSLDAGTPVNCMSPYTVTGLTDRVHTMMVTATDIAGNKSGTSSYSWRVDTVAPTMPQLTSPESAVTSNTNAAFNFLSSDSNGSGIARYECTLDVSAPVTCAPTYIVSGLKDGNHTMSVIAIDVAGNRSTPATLSWRVDSVAPAMPTIASTEKGMTYNTSATVTFSSTDSGGGLRYECGVDGAARTSCASPYALTALRNGDHVVAVTAIDAAGNRSPEASVKWETVPNVAPNAIPVLAASAFSGAMTVVQNGVALEWGSLWPSTLVPRQVRNFPSATISQIEQGTYQGCALIGGAVQCWQTQSGDRAETIRTGKPVPGWEGPLTQLKLGVNVQCGIKNGALTCRGVGGRLGTGPNQVATEIPVQVAGLDHDVSRVATGTDAACAIQMGTVWCWGFRFKTARWAGSYFDINEKPVREGPKSGVTALAVVDTGGCAISAGALYCWGSNSSGLLGDPKVAVTEVRPDATIVQGFESGVTSLSAGFESICAVRNGAVFCWGGKLDGSVTNGYVTSTNDIWFTPTAIPGAESGVTSVAVSGDHACAIRNGGVVCWGRNAEGALGNGSIASSATAVPVTGLTSGF